VSFDWILQLLAAENLGIAAQAADVASRKTFSAPLKWREPVWGGYEGQGANRQ
jgi:hypothetical protein